MSQVKPKFSIGLFCRIAYILWVFILTYFVFHNLGTTGKLIQVVSSEEKAQSEQSINHKFNALTDQVLILQTDHKALQATVEKLDQAKQNLALTVSKEMQNYVQHETLINLNTQIMALQEAVKILQEAKAVQVTSSPATAINAPPSKAAVPRPVVQIPPFKVIGQEIRGGEPYVSVLPSGKDAVSSIQIVRAGQSVGNWVLQSISDGIAVFKSGNQTRRIPIPQ